MKITRIDAFQIRWTPDEKPSQHSAFVQVHTDSGLAGLGEASPMQGGLASLVIIKHHLRRIAARPGPAGPRRACSIARCTRW